jgi:hypothetical protein
MSPLNPRICVLLFILLFSQAQAQWSSDPQGHVLYSCGIYQVSSGSNTSLCSDGLGGIFYTTGFTTGTWADLRRLWVFHLNANGYPTLQGTECPNMIRVDSTIYGMGFSGFAARLIPSEPPGSVIVLFPRYALDSFLNPTCLGMVIAKFDTIGLTGFGRIFIPADTTLIFGGRGYEGLWDYEGSEGGIGDLHGGVHLIFWRASVGYFYNHLSADGTFRYQLPGVVMRGDNLHSDGTGGVWDIWSDPEVPGQLRVQRYNAVGDSVYDGGGLGPAVNCGAFSIPLASNHALFRTSHQTSGGLYDQNLFLLDTNFVNQWEPEGNLFRTGDSLVGAIIPDRIGGFLYYERGSIYDTLFTTHHYDSEAQLIASGTRSRHFPLPTDGLGGAYCYEWPGQVWRWQPDMTLAWPDCVVVHDVNMEWGSAKYTAVEGGGLVGVIEASTGFGFYHLNLDGCLGPLDASSPRVPIPGQFRILSVYPNPFNGSARIRFSSTSGRLLRLVIYDILGRKVQASEPRWSTPGISEWQWEPQALASGQYFVRLQTEDGRHGIESPAARITHLK